MCDPDCVYVSLSVCVCILPVELLQKKHWISWNWSFVLSCFKIHLFLGVCVLQVPCVCIVGACVCTADFLEL